MSYLGLNPWIPSHEPGRAELLLSPKIRAAQQRRPTRGWFMGREHGLEAKGLFHVLLIWTGWDKLHPLLARWGVKLAALVRMPLPAKGLGARHGWVALLIWLVAPGIEAATIAEDFSGDPLAQGWQVFGDASLFHWNPANQNLEVTWDSSQGNSYFYRPLPAVLGKNDDFSLAFELQLKDVAVGLSPDKPFTFEVAVGLFNRTQAMGTNFVRGTAKDSPNLAEFDYFPDSGFGATVSLALISSNHQFLASMNYPLELTAGDAFQVTMRYTASNRTLSTVMTRNGESFGPIQDLKLSAAFTDFQVDTVSISSYNDEQSGGSLLAHGVVDNVTVTVPELPIAGFAGAMVDGWWQAEFVGRMGWTYVLEQTSDFRTWTGIAGPLPGTGGRQVLTDTRHASGAWFYRVRAER